MFLFQTTQTAAKQTGQTTDLSTFKGFPMNKPEKDSPPTLEIFKLKPKKQAMGVTEKYRETIGIKYRKEISASEISKLDQQLLGTNSSAIFRLDYTKAGKQEEAYVKVQISGGERKEKLESGETVYSDIKLTGIQVDRYGKPLKGSKQFELLLDYEKGERDTRGQTEVEREIGKYGTLGGVATAISLSIINPLAAFVVGAVLEFGLFSTSSAFGGAHQTTSYLSDIKADSKEFGSLAPKNTSISLLAVQLGVEAGNTVYFGSKKDFANYQKLVEKAEKKVFGKGMTGASSRLGSWDVKYESDFGKQTLPGATYQGVNSNGELVFTAPEVMSSFAFKPENIIEVKR